MSRRNWEGGVGKVALVGVAALLAAGCAGQGRHKPFSDVVKGNQTQALHAEAGQEAEVVTPAPVTPAAPAPQTVVAAVAPAEPAVTLPATEPAAVKPMLPAVTLPASVEEVPLIVRDDGVLRRPWPITVAYRPSGDVIAGRTYYEDITDEASKRPEWLQAAMETPWFLVDTVILPVRAVKTPPWAPVLYNSDPGGWQWQPLEPGEHLYAE